LTHCVNVVQHLAAVSCRAFTWLLTTKRIAAAYDRCDDRVVRMRAAAGRHRRALAIQTIDAVVVGSAYTTPERQRLYLDQRQRSADRLDNIITAT